MSAADDAAYLRDWAMTFARTPQSLLYAGSARPEIRGYEADVTASLYFDNEDS